MTDENRLLTDDEKTHFAKWETFFQSEGWEMLSDELRKELEEAPAELFLSVSSWEELLAARARMAVLAQLLRYPYLIALRKEHIALTRAAELEDELDDARGGL